MLNRVRTLATQHYRRWHRDAAAIIRSESRRLGPWPLLWSPRPLQGPPKIAYYIGSFPVTSETFIQREIAALLSVGTEVHLVAGRRTQEFLDDIGQSLVARTEYLDHVSLDERKRRIAHEHRLAARRVRTMQAYLYFGHHASVATPADEQNMVDRALLLASRLRDAGATHVHAPWASEDALLAMLAAYALRITFSAQARAFEIHKVRAAVGLDLRLRHASFIVTNSEYNRTILEQRLGRRRPPIHVVKNGVHLSQFADTAPPPRVIDGTIRVVSVGRLCEQKGYAILLDALRQLRSLGVSVECEIVGGRVRSEIYTAVALRRQLVRLGLEEVVRFRGSLPPLQTRALMKSADLLVQPCVIARDGSRDVTPNVLIEAMALKIPVISTLLAAIPELVENGVTGRLVPPGDARAIAAAIRQLAADVSLRARYVEAGRKRVERMFNSLDNVQSHAELFASTVRSTPQRRSMWRTKTSR